MVREAQIPAKKLQRLARQPHKKDELLKKTYGLTDRELAMIRRGSDFYRRASHAAHMLVKHGATNQITLHTLATLCDGTGEKYATVKNRINKELQKAHEKQQLTIERDTGYKVPTLELLRAHEGIGNPETLLGLYIWEHYCPSPQDFERSIRVPFTIDETVTTLIGILWGGATLTKHKANKQLLICGKEKEREFYEEVVQPLFKQVHGIHIPVADSTPYMLIGSEGIITWLTGDLGFPKDKETIKPPRRHSTWTKNLHYGYFKGLLATMGFVIARENKPPSIGMSKLGTPFLETVQKLARRLGYTPHLYQRLGRSNQSILRFSPRDTEQLVLEDALINHHHLERLEAAIRQSSQSQYSGLREYALS